MEELEQNVGRSESGPGKHFWLKIYLLGSGFPLFWEKLGTPWSFQQQPPPRGNLAGQFFIYKQNDKVCNVNIAVCCGARMRSYPACNAGHGHKRDKDAVYPEGPEGADALCVAAAVVLLPLHQAPVHTPVHPLKLSTA